MHDPGGSQTGQKSLSCGSRLALGAQPQDDGLLSGHMMRTLSTVLLGELNVVERHSPNKCSFGRGAFRHQAFSAYAQPISETESPLWETEIMGLH